MANLIAYYTREGENYWNGGIRVINKGNTERIAEFVQDAVGGDLLRIETAQDYPESYQECIKVAKRELQQNARPELKPVPDNLDEYDTIFLGYPNWWGTCPMAVFSFLERYDLSGKRIVPFCTNEGSGMGSSERHLKKAFPKAKIESGLAIAGHDAAESRDRVSAWAKGVAEV